MGSTVSMAVFTCPGFEIVRVPLGCCLLASVGLFASVSWAAVYNLTVEGLGEYTEAASGLVMTALVGGGLLPLAQGLVADRIGYGVSYALPAFGAAYLLVYALFFTRQSNRLPLPLQVVRQAGKDPATGGENPQGFLCAHTGRLERQ